MKCTLASLIGTVVVAFTAPDSASVSIGFTLGVAMVELFNYFERG